MSSNKRLKIEPMQREKRDKQDLKIKGANNVRLTTYYLNPAYKIPDVKTSSLTTRTDQLELFKLEPLEKTLPTFCGRWDRKEGLVDIDLVRVSPPEQGVNPREQTFFRNERNGYEGHHTKKIVGPKSRFEIDISIPQLHVFRGNIVLNLETGQRVGGQVRFAGKLKSFLIRS